MKKSLSFPYLRSLVVVLACFTLVPITHAVRPPRGEDRGDGNSAAEDIDALNLSTAGPNNTAHGWSSLFSNALGRDNTADGFQALYSNTDGVSNTAEGSQALYNNTAGSYNTAIGRLALNANTVGNFNTGIGEIALFNNVGSGGNTAVGYSALYNSTTGRQNTALGYYAGFNVTDALNVICIGSPGGNVTSSAWIGNVYGVTTQSGATAPVVVSDGGQLGTVASSERFKKDIASMQNTSEVILSLRPVTFHYKTDAKETPQFGLIAEEVAKVNPDLVLQDQKGKPYTVRYDAVNAMLLNEFLKEHRKVEKLEAQLRAVNHRLADQDAKIEKVSMQLKLSQAAPRTVLNQ